MMAPYGGSGYGWGGSTGASYGAMQGPQFPGGQPQQGMPQYGGMGGSQGYMPGIGGGYPGGMSPYGPFGGVNNGGATGQQQQMTMNGTYGAASGGGYGGMPSMYGPGQGGPYGSGFAGQQQNPGAYGPGVNGAYGSMVNQGPQQSPRINNTVTPLRPQPQAQAPVQQPRQVGPVHGNAPAGMPPTAQAMPNNTPWQMANSVSSAMNGYTPRTTPITQRARDPAIAAPIRSS